MSRLKNKRAIITGAARGIGLGLAKHFVQEGCEVVLTDIDVEAGSREAEAYPPGSFDSMYAPKTIGRCWKSYARRRTFSSIMRG
ncbi:SDR family NAD(P)-dependent oxidoreductase [Asaia astilbis]|uniref:SDR family NAD(P)-dependent oxidoreductase n=1 Tax=Asaia astilbis TaxID=610244 RepID=UPI000470713F